MRIGLFGGSFNPAHLGHLLVARSAFEEKALDRVFIVPAAQSPFKPGVPLAPAAQRLQLLRAAFAGCAWTEVDEQEVRRGGVSYSIDTVRDYARRFPGAALFYLIGADHAAQLPKWRDAPELADLAEFLIIPRPGERWEGLPRPFRGEALRGYPIGVSASAIRDRIKRGLSITGLVPEVVAELIQNNGLYL